VKKNGRGCVTTRTNQAGQPQQEAAKPRAEVTLPTVRSEKKGVEEIRWKKHPDQEKKMEKKTK